MYDLKRNFSFYASYHHDRVNVAIHFLCIWPILATAIAMLQYTPVVAATPDFMQNTGLKVNFAFIVALIYMGKWEGEGYEIMSRKNLMEKNNKIVME